MVCLLESSKFLKNEALRREKLYFQAYSRPQIGFETLLVLICCRSYFLQNFNKHFYLTTSGFSNLSVLTEKVEIFK